MKKIVPIIVFVVLAALLAAGGLLASSFYARPLAEPMTVQMAQPAAAAQEPVAAAPAAQKTQTCGRSGSLKILFTGADFSKGVYPLGADSVRLVEVDYDAKQIVVAAFPRDLLLKTPGLAKLNVAESRLGLAYHQMKEATTGETKHRITTATGLVAQTLYDNFVYPAENKDYYYFTLQLDEVGAMIDTIGGVEITLPAAITSDYDVTFPAGNQVLDGKLSAEFVRTYEPGGDPARLKRQNLYVKSLQDQVLSAEILPKIPELYKQFDKAIVTDLSPKQLESLACMSKAVAQEDILFHEIGLENGLVTAAADGALIPDVEQIKAALLEWFGE